MLLTASNIREGVLLCGHIPSAQGVKADTGGKKEYPIANPVGTITNLVVAYHVQQRHDIGPAGQVLEDFDLALYLLLLDGLEHFDDALLVVDDVDALEDLGVLAPPDLAHDFVVLEHAPANVDAVVVPVGAGHVCVDVGVDAGDRRRPASAVERHVGAGGGWAALVRCWVVVQALFCSDGGRGREVLRGCCGPKGEDANQD